MARAPLDKLLPPLDLNGSSQDETQASASASTPFDFETELPTGPRENVTSRIDVIVARLSTAIIETGVDLIAIGEIIKKHGKKGAWSRFLASGLPFSESSARNYMRAARLKNSATVAEIELLQPTAMYAAACAPLEVRRDIETLLVDGVVVTTADIRDMVARKAEGAEQDHAAADQDNAPGFVDPEAKRAAAAPRRVRASQDSSRADERNHAGHELVAQLRERYEDSQIRSLNDLWKEAGHAKVEQILNEGPK